MSSPLPEGWVQTQTVWPEMVKAVHMPPRTVGNLALAMYPRRSMCPHVTIARLVRKRRSGIVKDHTDKSITPERISTSTWWDSRGTPHGSVALC